MAKLSRNIGSLFLSDIVSRGFGFIVTVYLARVLTIRGFGLISYGLAFLTYALLFVNPGLTTIGAREIAKNHSNKKLVEEIIGLKMTIGFVVFVVFGVGLILIPGDPLTKKIIFIYLFSLFPFTILLEFVFQGTQDMEYIAASRFIHYLVYFVFIFLLVKGSGDVAKVPLSYFLGYALGTGFLLIVFSGRYGLLRLRFARRRWYDLLRISIPVGLATIFNQLLLNFPPVILGIFHCKEEVALFSAAFKIILMLLIIERVFYFVFFPVFSRQYRSEPTKLKSSFMFISKLLFAVTIPIAAGGILLSHEMIGFIYGVKFADAAPVLQLLLLYFIVTPLNTIFGYGLVAVDEQRKFLKVIFITSLINLFLIVVLSLYFKAQGAAAAIFVSELLGVILMNRELKKKIAFNTLKAAVKPTTAALIMAALLYRLQDIHFLLRILMGVFVYIIIMLLIKGFSRSEYRKMKAVFGEERKRIP